MQNPITKLSINFLVNEKSNTIQKFVKIIFLARYHNYILLR